METIIQDHNNLIQIGEALQIARKRASITQEAAAEIIGVARTTIVAMEKGERRIKATELLKLARAYGRPISEFVESKPQAEPFEVQFRGPSIRSDKDDLEIEPIVREFEELCTNYSNMERLLDAPLNRRYPAEYSLHGLTIDQAAENIAMMERQRLNLGDGPLSVLRDILEQDIGMRVFYIPMPSKFSEMYFYSDHLGGCLAINQNHPEERRRLSMAHGYAHFLTSRFKPVVDADGQYQRKPDSERFADAFATYFLMPTSGLVRRFTDLHRAKDKLTLGDLCTLAHFYWVSLEALVRRLEDLRLIGAGKADTIKSSGFKVGEAKQQLGLSEIPVRADRLPTRYQYLALDAFKNEVIGEGQFARLLGVDRLEARRVANNLRQTGMEFESSFDLPEFVGTRG
ncbi:MAG: XRE family transcriptional regulator [Chthonomonadales bacterium]